jgi:hypothetical protein
MMLEMERVSDPFAACAIGHLLNLEAAQQGRSMLLSGEQNSTFEGREKRGLHRPSK